MKYQKEIEVLIAEDDYLVGEMIKGVLEERGYIIAGEATNGLEAVEMVAQLHPDVVLMDIKMPDLDGIGATRLIYQRTPVPIVVLTAYETTELVEQASEAGVGAYLVKPPNAQELERAITIAMARFDDMIELRRLNQELQARNEELDAFSHSVAHDLQAPLTLITGYAQHLQEEFRLPEQIHDYVSSIRRNGVKMNNIIRELQLLAGIRRADVEPKPMHMARIIAQAQQRLAYLIEQKEARISLPEYWPSALGYGPWIEEVWATYMSNAIQYGGNPPRVQLGATERSNKTVRFWVRDNGPGLSAEEQGRLFKPLKHVQQLELTGYGLGLSVVRRIVEKLGGEVGVQSDGIPGQGSTFFFTLPGV